MSNGYLGEVHIQLETNTVRATTRKLKATWTMEPQQDLRAAVEETAQPWLDVLYEEEDRFDPELFIQDLRRQFRSKKEKLEPVDWISEGF